MFIIYPERDYPDDGAVHYRQRFLALPAGVDLMSPLAVQFVAIILGGATTRGYLQK